MKTTRQDNTAIELAEKGFAGVREVVGLAMDSVSDTTDVLERDTVIFPKFHREKCLGCGRCVEGPRGKFEKSIRRIERDGTEIALSPAVGKQKAKEGDG